MIAVLCAFRVLAQDLTEAEQKSLSEALGEAGSSPIEFVRALENHLARYPESPKRPELERALVKAAIETKDDRRIIQYGERVLSREQDDLQILERVARALLSSDVKETSGRALKYSRRYHELVTAARLQPALGRVSDAQWQEELDRGEARALSLEARATGNVGNQDQAIALAKASYKVYPTAEAAREVARWLVRAGREKEAIPFFADAFTVQDPKNSEQTRAADRKRMGELYAKLTGGEKGLGDIILESYDRNQASHEERQKRMGQADPNSQAAKILDFTLSGLKGDKMKLSSLAGKAVVFDFWATWCGPCRAQYPLYEQVKEKYRNNPDVVFLAVSTDEDRSIVEPFLREQKWSKATYFEDGLARSLQINSIPTTIVLNRKGEVVSRLNGFVPDRFVRMLTERIDDALK
ncbi:MAG: thioredoxin-like domain-containing protein [Bryobacteraceae bacterium]